MNNRSLKYYFGKHYIGTSLLEILVTLLITSIGLLATAKMQIIALRLTKSAEIHSLALKQALMTAEQLYIAPFKSFTKTDDVSIKTTISQQGNQQRLDVAWPFPATNYVTQQCAGKKDHQCFYYLVPKMLAKN